jgi:molybdopterin molybdotransferase
MISPQSARRLIADHATPLGSVSVPLEDTLGYVLAEAVRASMALPRFDNSAMDGFAVRFSDTADATTDCPVTLQIDGTVFAGDNAARLLRAGHACGIMTGAPLPKGADTIIPIEQAIVRGARLIVDGPVDRHRHVRKRGEETRRGTVVLKAGDVIHPGTIACLAAFGRTHVRVVRRPTVSLITTGDEAVTPGQRLAQGQIYDSNSYMLKAMVRQMGMEVVRSRRVKDHATALANATQAALASSDVLIVVGGVSVGERDYLRPVLDKLRVKKVFWRVAQQPGKPLYFGVKEKRKRLVFGLPGNPASAFTCFYVYVYAALKRMAGFDVIEPRRDVLLAEGDMAQVPNKWRFLKARVERGGGGRVRALPHQGSHMITSLSQTNSLIVVPPAEQAVEGTAEMDTYRLPHMEDNT